LPIAGHPTLRRKVEGKRLDLGEELVHRHLPYFCAVTPRRQM
jgi:hypothetical protein